MRVLGGIENEVFSSKERWLLSVSFSKRKALKI